MMRIFGIILISVSISLYGSFLSHNLKKAANQRKALLELLMLAKSAFANGIALSKVFDSFSNAELEKCGFLSVLKSGCEKPFSKAISESGILLSPKLKELYLELGENMGTSPFSSNESDKLSFYLERIKLEEAKMSENEEARRVLYNKMGVLAGVLAALLLL